MRIHIAHLHSAGLAEFVGARFAVPQNPILDAGLGDFVGASYAVPQNPILDAMGGGTGLAEFVAANFTLPQNPILDAGMGDMVGTAAMYPIPINSVLQEVQDGAGLGDCGCGCGGDGGCGGGLGTLTDDISSFISTQWASIQAGDMATIALWGGGALLLGFLLFGMPKGGRSAYASGKKELRSEYKKKLARLRAESPSVARRLTSAGRAAAGAF